LDAIAEHSLTLVAFRRVGPLQIHAPSGGKLGQRELF
jgi:hypothetical protein